MSSLQSLARLVVVIGFASTPSLRADDVDHAVALGTQAGKDVAKTTDKTRSDLADIRAETELNQLEQPDPAPLAAFSDTLGEMPSAQVGPINDSLTLAAAASNDAARRDALVTAFTRQKALELALKDASAEFSPAEAQIRLLRHVAALLSRQMTNIRMTGMVGTVADSPADLAGSPRRRYTVVGVEQSALELELALINRTVDRTPAEFSDIGPTQTALAVKDGLRETALPSAAQNATAATRSGSLSRAVLRQKAVEEKLSRLLDEVLTVEPKRRTGRLAAKLLKQLTADERALRTATEKQTPDRATLAERQDRIQDRTEVLKRLLAVLDPELAKRAAGACKKMGEASNCLKPGGSGAGAVPAENGAIALLEEAGKMLAADESGGNEPGPGDGGVGEGDDDDGDDGHGKKGRGIGGDGGTPKDQDSPNLIPGEKNLPPATAMVLGELARKEREALAPSEPDKTLPQYAPLVEQYLRSLSAPPPASP
ncbi:MAG TPA: hypothetical protein VIM44_07245 [Rariglobus sp.]